METSNRYVTDLSFSMFAQRCLMDAGERFAPDKLLPFPMLRIFDTSLCPDAVDENCCQFLNIFSQIILLKNARAGARPNPLPQIHITH